MPRRYASITYETISDYVDALRKLFVLEDMPAWDPNLRSKTAIQSSETRYFVDPSIATDALGVTVQRYEEIRDIFWA